MIARKDLGFTLVEVITVVLIIAVLAAIVYPSYQGMMRRARRAEAVTILNDVQLRLEKYRVDHADYAGYMDDELIPKPVMSTPFYTVTVTDETPTAYKITAAPRGNQLNDVCGDLVLNYANGETDREDEAGGEEDCW